MSERIIWVLITLAGLSGLGWVINTQNPTGVFALFMFFSLLFIVLFSLTFFITNIVRHSVLAGGGVFGFFLLRYLGLREPVYVILLILCLISLELYFRKR